MQMLLPRSGVVKDGARRADWTNMAGVECWIVRPDPLPEVRVTPQKRATKRRAGGRRATVPRARRAAAEALPLEPILAPIEEAPAGLLLEERPLPSDLATIDVEPVFAGRVPPPEPERPLPSARRAIFFDVENTSRAEHIARMVDHLAVDRRGLRTDLVAVGHWRVIGHDTARPPARPRAHLRPPPPPPFRRRAVATSTRPRGSSTRRRTTRSSASCGISSEPRVAAWSPSTRWPTRSSRAASAARPARRASSPGCVASRS